MQYRVNATPGYYVCTDCQTKGIKLWRLYNTFLDQQEFLCAACACKKEGKEDNVGDDGRRTCDEGFGEMRTDQIGWMVPAVPTEDDSTYWGYCSVPEEGVNWWRALPTRPLEESPSWYQDQDGIRNNTST